MVAKQKARATEDQDPAERGEPLDKRRRIQAPHEETVKDINDIVTPMWRLEYADQIRKKRNRILKKLKAVQKKIRKTSEYDLPDWIKQTKPSAQCCPFKEFMKMGEGCRNGYRNKSTFTIGRDIAGRPCVGFALGRTEKGLTAVADPTGCRNIAKEAQAARDLLQGFIESSPLSPYEKVARSGFWREAIVRSTQFGQVMLIVQANHESVSESALNEAKNQLKGHIATSVAIKITSLYFQAYSGASNKAKLQLLMTLKWIFYGENPTSMRLCLVLNSGSHRRHFFK